MKKTNNFFVFRATEFQSPSKERSNDFAPEEQRQATILTLSGDQGLAAKWTWDHF